MEETFLNKLNHPKTIYELGKWTTFLKHCTPDFGYSPRFCPAKVDHMAKMTIYPKNLVLKSD